MRVCKRAVFASVLALASSVLAVAQAPRLAPDQHPQFDVATITPSDPAIGARAQGWFIHGRQVEIRYQTVASLIMYAYGIHPKQIVDAPEWIASDRWNIRGVADLPGEPSHPQMQEMLKSLLADRFSLVLRHEPRDMPAYTITTARGRARLQPARGAPEAQPDQDAGQDPHGVWLRMSNVNMQQFALYMQFFVDRPVVDHTGLKGRYDVMLKWKPATAEPSETGEDYPSFLQATEEQLGLKFVPGKDTVDALVVAKVEKPSAN